MVGGIFIDGMRRREILLSVEILKYDLIVVEENQAAADNAIAMEYRSRRTFLAARYPEQKMTAP